MCNQKINPATWDAKFSESAMKRFPGVGKEKIPKRGSRERKLRDVFTEKFSTAGKVSKGCDVQQNMFCHVTSKGSPDFRWKHTSWAMRGCLSHSLSLHQLSTRSRSSPVRNAWLLLGLHHFAHSALEKEDHLCPPLFSRYHYCKTSGEKTM